VVDVAVQEVMKTGDFQTIAVIDRENIVRAAGDPARVGQPYARPAGEALASPDPRVAVSRQRVQGAPVLGFETAITFQGKPVGRVALALEERPLVRVARLSLGLLAALVLVTVLAVAVAMYFVADWFARPVKLVIEAMEEVARGHVEHRIAEPRKDEFGLLFAAFDHMAQALQEARGRGGASLANTVTRGPAAALAAAQAANPSSASAATTSAALPLADETPVPPALPT
jgi:HAMP domain-containing protein